MFLRKRFPLLVLLVLFLYLLTVLISHQLQVRNFLSYSTRPLWDKPDGPTSVLPHFYAEGVPIDADLCALHGWAARPADDRPPVWDAVLVSTELDLLEIRMHELRDVVSTFFIVESDRTFTGIPKPLAFAAARARFAAFEDRLVYSVFRARALAPGESPFANEIAQRRHMDALLRAHAAGAPAPPLVLFSDVDEIPYAHTLALLARCAAPTPLHLQMREFLYSFEWPAGEGSWRAQVHRYAAGDAAVGYGHSQATDVKLADAGWHCSFCFRTIEEFSAKMEGYSHADRVTDKSLLDPKHIQQVVCDGSDIFGMLPEAYRWKDLFTLMHKDPTPSAVHLPRYLLQNSDRFRFLLPGGCMRNSS
ncbi:glycosyltransferase family 17 protein [Phanerochaete sordida]|uniref:Glycosyltransferase family 17 protein n=1 Tax=Phanerochaete sordida TaxID=48140 RepID=A0A9P3G7V1_9APHY|nr:glycosyltransferase family 17 protein [Phanerochaete sordida]